MSNEHETKTSSGHINIELEGKLIERTIARREEILVKADNEAQNILAEKQGQADAIIKDADAEVVKILASVVKGVRDRIIGASEIEGRKILMIERDKLLNEIYTDATKQVAAAYNDKKNHHEILVKLLAEACASIGGKDFIVSANESDLTEIKHAHKSISNEVSNLVGYALVLDLDKTPIDTSGGVVVKNKDGDKIYYNTLENRIEKAKSKLDVKITKMMGA